uniref:Ribosome biogenesis regulatory protein n=1 Tax=Strombidinopsis acuminata TaxID=141414 RepID=A0A7S3RLK7_9SPIT
MAAYDISPLSTKVDFMAYTRDSVQLLVNKMFTLNKVRIEEGMALELPKEEVFRLPRQRPVPKDKPKTRFQKFMEEKNMQKRKRSRLVFDDVSQDWVPRWGYGSVKKNQEKAQWLHEVKEGEDPYADPFERKAVEQKLVAAKQKMREVRNKVEAAGGKLRASVADLKDGKVNSGRGKDALREAIKRAQTASGSRGKFDRTAPNEATNLQPKKKHKGVTKSLGEEKAAYLKTATRLLSGGVDKDKAAKVGASGGATQVPRGKKGKSNLAARRSKNGGRMHHKK